MSTNYRNTLMPLDGLHREMNRWMNDAGAEWPASNASRLAMDVYEKDDVYHVETALPGFSMDDVELTVIGRQLGITAKREQVAVEDATYHIRSNARQSVSETLKFPSELDVDGVSAMLEMGVLKVTLPKSAKATPRKITIS